MSSPLENICVTEHEIEFTPSRNDGVSKEIESALRRYGCEVIANASKLLELTQVATAMAQTLFHRFYCTVSFTDYDVDISAAVCVLLASKLAECVRSLRAVISVLICIKFRRLQAEKDGSKSKLDPMPAISMSSMYFYQLRQSAIRYERTLLEKLGFNTYIELPYKFFLNYLNVLQIAKHRTLPQYAWNCLNDSMRTLASIRYLPEALACGALYHASKALGISMPKEPVPWWTLFNATLDEIDDISAMLDELYADPTPQYVDVLKTNSAPTSLEEFVAAITNTEPSSSASKTAPHQLGASKNGRSDGSSGIPKTWNLNCQINSRFRLKKANFGSKQRKIHKIQYRRQPWRCHTMTNRECIRRLQREYQNLLKEPPSGFVAQPNPDNLLEWHYLLDGPEGTPYHGGTFHGKIKFPDQYPHKPPAIMMITPSGRFMPETRLCLSYSDFHPETWNPMWSVSTILTGLVSFMTSSEDAVGTIASTDAVKRAYAKASMDYNRKNPVFQKQFPDRCGDSTPSSSAPNPSTTPKPATSSAALTVATATPSTADPAPSRANTAPLSNTGNNTAPVAATNVQAVKARTPSPAAATASASQSGGPQTCKAIAVMILVAIVAIWLNRVL